jgi:hypothetical protein
MISVIIPTLFKVNRIYETLKELSECPFVDEIILIDNTDIKKDININKVKYIFEGLNKFVNPSWNKGVEISTNNELCILNDDIWFDWSIFGNIISHISEENGIIGMSSTNYTHPTVRDFKIEPILSNKKTSKGDRPFGYGCCFFINKKNWINIPEEMLIWAGDDFIFYYKNNLINYEISGIECFGGMSVTSDDEDLSRVFDPIKRNDMLIMKDIIRKGYVENYLIGTIWE